MCQAGIALFLCHPECVMFVSCTCLFYVLCQVLLLACHAGVAFSLCHAGVALIYLSRRSRLCLRVMQKVSCSCLPRLSPLACDPRGRCPTRVPCGRHEGHGNSNEERRTKQGFFPPRVEEEIRRGSFRRRGILWASWRGRDPSFPPRPRPDAGILLGRGRWLRGIG